MHRQRTLKNKVTCSGIGLHSGRKVVMTLRPASAGTGIVFHRTDLTPPVSIEACAANVVNTRLSTTIGNGVASVATIEHLMAALRGMGIDNAHVDIDGPEVPIMDGSAAPFVTFLGNAGTTALGTSRRYLVVKKPVSVTDGEKSATITPSRYFRISFDMRFSHPVVNSQFRSLKFSGETFVHEVAPARTFGFLAELEMLKANGLARGASLDNAVGIDDNGVVNPEGLRFADEFVRHKILDAIGDFALAGYPLVGHVKAIRSGHDLNHRLVSELLSRRECWQLVEFASRATPPPFSLSMPGLAWSKA